MENKTRLLIAINKRGMLLIGEHADKEMGNSPKEVVWHGEIRNIIGLPELVQFALKAARKDGIIAAKLAEWG